MAREGPFTNERSQASLRVLGKGCAFRHTTYSAEDHAPPEGGLGVPLNHPRFPGSGYDGGDAPTQRRVSNADELGHFRPVCVGTTWDGLEVTTTDNWRRPIPESGGNSRSTGHARTSSFGPHGGIRALETLVGPGAARDFTGVGPASGTSSMNIRTINDISVLIYMSDAGNSVGPEPRVVVLFFSYRISSCEVFRLRYLGYTLEWSLVLEHVCAGGGNVTFNV